MKNSNKKQKFSEALTEALLEILIGAVLLIVGFSLTCLFDANMPLLETAPEIFILIGLGFISFIFFSLYIIRWIIRRKRITNPDFKKDKIKKNKEYKKWQDTKGI